MKTQLFETDKEWEDWLENNFDKQQELWLVYYKKHTGKTCISYDDSVRIALCYGWIDGLMKKLDEERYARRFTPRKNKSIWSDLNKVRVEELIKSGKMKKPGLDKVEFAKQNGIWDQMIYPTKIDLSLPSELKQAFEANKTAAAFFESLSKSHKKEYIIWIKTAKRPETRERRTNETIKMLNEKKKLGIK